MRTDQDARWKRAFDSGQHERLIEWEARKAESAQKAEFDATVARVAHGLDLARRAGDGLGWLDCWAWAEFIVAQRTPPTV